MAQEGVQLAALLACSWAGSVRPKRPCCASWPSRSRVKKVGMVTLAPAPSMGSRAEVSGNRSRGPAPEVRPTAAEAAAGVGAGIAGSTAASAAATLVLLLLLVVPVALIGKPCTAPGGVRCPAGSTAANCCSCCCWCQPRRAALSTAASEGSWYWQLHTTQAGVRKGSSSRRPQSR